MAICPNGHKNPQNQPFCGECGAAIGEAIQTTSVAAESRLEQLAAEIDTERGEFEAGRTPLVEFQTFMDHARSEEEQIVDLVKHDQTEPCNPLPSEKRAAAPKQRANPHQTPGLQRSPQGEKLAPHEPQGQPLMGFRRTPDQSSRGGNYVEPGWPQNAAPYYRPTLLVAIAASAGIILGSVGTWAHVLMFNVDGLDFGNWGVATLILGVASCIALLTVWFWSRTPFDSQWAVPFAWGIVVAAVACLVDAVINIVRLMTAPKGDIFGVPLGPSVGWGLWLVGFSAAVMCVTTSIVATQISKSSNLSRPSGRSGTSWTNGWMAAALTVSAIIVVAGTIYVATHRFGGDEGSSSGMPPFPNPFSTSESPSQPPKTVSAGQEVRVGGVSFKVTSVHRQSSVGDPDDMFNYQTAHGVYEIVYYTVNNVGNEPESVDSMSQKLFIDNREYSSDMMASENVSRQVRDSAFLNPGFSADLVVAFDVPTGSREGVLEVHTSSFSDKGARIDLSNASG